jgi:aldehyde:ferredoxin oxidoreductase
MAKLPWYMYIKDHSVHFRYSWILWITFKVKVIKMLKKYQIL